MPFFAKRTSSGDPQAKTKPLEPSGHRAAPFAAVSIRPSPRACKGARQLAGKRLLRCEAPPLPLPSCGVLCTCAYRTYTDRRQESRRGVDVGISGSYYFGPDRRERRERRVAPRVAADSDYYDFVAATTARPSRRA